MNLSVLNTNLSTIAIIDTYESLIWTERYSKCGDFEIYQPISKSIPWYIKQEYILTKEDSKRAMIIEGLEIKHDADTGDHIAITGRSLESILERRIVWGHKNFNGGFQESIKTLLEENIINPTDPKRKIENFIFKESEDLRITSLKVEGQYKGDNLLEVVEKLCGDYDVGFRITLDELNQFVFELYIGEDRSYEQIENPHIVFSPEYENLINSNYLTSTVNYKNVTLVIGEGEPDECMTVTVGDDTVTGLARREMFSDASDISRGTNDVDYDSETVEKPGSGLVTLYPSGAHIPVDENDYTEVIDGVVITTPSTGITIKDYPQTFAMRSGVAVAAEEESQPLTDEEYRALLVERGGEDLREHPYTITFDGEADTTRMYKYGEDFFDGDIVQFANEYGHEARVRITEFIVTHDQNGISTYPTFSTIVRDAYIGEHDTCFEFLSLEDVQTILDNPESIVKDHGKHKVCFDYLTIGDIRAIMNEANLEDESTNKNTICFTYLTIDEAKSIIESVE